MSVLTPHLKREPIMEMLNTTPIELTDRQWENIKGLFDCRRKRKHSLRGILDAVLFVIDNNINWRELPAHYAPWQTVYYYFDKWRKTGVWDRVVEFLPAELREKAQASLSPHYALYDMHVVRRPVQRQAPRPAARPYSWIPENVIKEYMESQAQENRAA